ncbi:MAG: sodium:proton antiporter [Xenococcaceae cyanobacterium MO_207.B15]|nr:sodium:proton antiporter [Xenococcaceae cyanobacterium MO_207.B15]
MAHNLLLNTEIDILVLLLVACLAAITFKRIKFPYTVGLVIVGLVLSFLARNIEALEVVNTFRLSEQLILFIFVPPLIFESALNMESRLLLRNLSPVLVLAAPGLLISTAIVGAVLAWLTPLSLGQALLFGSLISATDPVAVIALFKELGAPKQLAVLVEGESLFNDATAIVAFNIIFATIVAGEVGRNAIQQGAMAFLISFVGGIIVGAVFGYLMSLTLNLAQENSLVLSTITTITAYGAFLIAEEVFEVSPVMAVVSAGLVIGWYKSNRLEAEVREYVGEFWEYAAFLANSLIFLLVGITASSFRFFEQLSQTQSLLTILGITIVTVLIARAIVVFTLVPLVNLFRESKIPFSYQLVSYWGGLRGAVCLALALSIDTEFPNRDLIVILTLGIALFTLLIPGTTIGKLIQTLQLNRPSILDRVGKALAMLIAKKEALQESSNLKTNDYFLPRVAEDFAQKCQQEVEQAKQSLNNLLQELNLSKTEAEQVVWSEALAIEQQVYNELQDQGFISETVLAQLTLMMNLKSDAVQAGNLPPELSTVKPIEVRLGNLLVKLFDGASWIEKIQANLIATEYEYLTFISYGCQQVPLRLRNLVADSGTSETAIENCLSHYEKIRQEKIEQAQAIVKQYPESAIAFQTKITDRVALVSQNQTIERLTSEGVISEAVAVQIGQLIEVE